MTTGTPSRASGSQALAGLGGEFMVPTWAVRPGSVEELRIIGRAMPLWTTIRSVNGTPYRPCFASETTLAETICCSRGTLRERMKDLRSVPGLLLEVQRPRDGIRIPTIHRWATDPFAVQVWRKLIAGVWLPEMAKEYGLGGDWLLGATKRLSRHAVRAQDLGEQIKVDLLTDPCTEFVQYGGGRGGMGRKPNRPRRKRKSGSVSVN
jgi:hypothetical protein